MLNKVQEVAIRNANNLKKTIKVTDIEKTATGVTFKATDLSMFNNRGMVTYSIVLNGDMVCSMVGGEMRNKWSVREYTA